MEGTRACAHTPKHANTRTRTHAREHTNTQNTRTHKHKYTHARAHTRTRTRKHLSHTHARTHLLAVLTHLSSPALAAFCVPLRAQALAMLTMPHKKRRLYDRMQFGINRKAAAADALRAKRQARGSDGA